MKRCVNYFKKIIEIKFEMNKVFLIYPCLLELTKVFIGIMIQKYLHSVRTYFVSTFSISLDYDIDHFVSVDQDFFSLIQV